jgi:hypothetical protein
MYPKLCRLWLQKCHTVHAKLAAKKYRRCLSNLANRGNPLIKTKVMA